MECAVASVGAIRSRCAASHPPHIQPPALTCPHRSTVFPCCTGMSSLSQACVFSVVVVMTLWSYFRTIATSSSVRDNPPPADYYPKLRQLFPGQPERVCLKCEGAPTPKPLRTHHCSICGCCVLKMDHRQHSAHNACRQTCRDSVRNEPHPTDCVRSRSHLHASSGLCVQTARGSPPVSDSRITNTSSSS